MSELDPRVSGAITAHSLLAAGLCAAHSLRTRTPGRALLLAAAGSAIPMLGELLAVNGLKMLRHHVRPQIGGVPLAIILGWYSVGYGTLTMAQGAGSAAGPYRGGEARNLALSAAVTATSLDLLLDPFGLDLGLWEWSGGGPYASRIKGPNGRRGIPLGNFAGWIVLIAGLALSYRRLEPACSAADVPDVADLTRVGRGRAERGAGLLLLLYYLPALAWAIRRGGLGYALLSAPFARALWAALRGRPRNP